jgi:hypothetical protein
VLPISRLVQWLGVLGSTSKSPSLSHPERNASSALFPGGFAVSLLLIGRKHHCLFALRSVRRSTRPDQVMKHEIDVGFEWLLDVNFFEFDKEDLPEKRAHKRAKPGRLAWRVNARPQKSSPFRRSAPSRHCSMASLGLGAGRVLVYRIRGDMLRPAAYGAKRTMAECWI